MVSLDVDSLLTLCSRSNRVLGKDLLLDSPATEGIVFKLFEMLLISKRFCFTLINDIYKVLKRLNDSIDFLHTNIDAKSISIADPNRRDVNFFIFYSSYV